MSDPTEAAIRRGERAAELLADPLVAGAFATLEARYIAAWRGSPVRDSEGRERLHGMLLTLDALRAEFEAAVAGGKVARANLAQEAAERRLNGLNGV